MSAWPFLGISVLTTILTPTGQSALRWVDPRPPQKAPVPQGTPWKSQLELAAKRHGLRASLLAALVSVESGGRVTAVRYEPAFEDNYIKGNPRWDPARAAGWSDRDLATSWGLTQVMGATAWSLGYHGSPRGMLLPARQLELGARYLRARVDRWRLKDLAYQGVRLGLVAYNGGDGAARAVAKGLPHQSLNYAKKVLAREKTLKGAV